MSIDPSRIFNAKVNIWIEKWTQSKVITKDCENFLKSFNPTAGKMYVEVTTHTNNSTLQIIKKGCNLAVKNLSIFAEKRLYTLADKLPSKIRQTDHILDTVDDINSLDIPNEFLLVSFGVINIVFSSIDNMSGLRTVGRELGKRVAKSTNCIRCY